jgi:hypothetical protein
MKKIFPIALIIIVLFGCRKLNLCKDDELSLARKDLKSDILRIDGCYWGGGDTTSSSPYVYIYYMYSNGVFFTTESSSYYDVLDSNIVIDYTNEFGKTIKAAWGVFQINDSIIEIDQWRPTLRGCTKTMYEKGRILDSNTFVINIIEYRDAGEVERSKEVEWMFHFYPLEQKPDSTNNFVN